MSDAPATKRRTRMATVTFTPSGESHRGALRHQPAGRGDPLRAPRPGPLRRAGPLRPLPRAHRERRGGAAQQRRARGRRGGRRLGRRLPDVQSPAEVEVDVPDRKRETVRPHGHAVAQPESLPITCDWRQNPAVRTFDIVLEPPSLDDNTSDLDRVGRALAQQHGIKEFRAELPMLRRLAKDLRMSNWRVNVALEMRDWVYGVYLPPG